MLPNCLSFDRLYSGNELAPGILMMSKNQAYFARLTQEGVFQIFVSNHFVEDNIIFRTKAPEIAKEGPFRLYFSLEGELKILDRKERVAWRSETGGEGKPPYQAILQNDGNFVIFDGGGNAMFCVGMIDR